MAKKAKRGSSRRRNVHEDLRKLETEFQNRSHEAAAREVVAFAMDPRNKYFERVGLTIGALLWSGAANGLTQAYEMACWADPKIRALLLKART